MIEEMLRGSATAAARMRRMVPVLVAVGLCPAPGARALTLPECGPPAGATDVVDHVLDSRTGAAAGSRSFEKNKQRVRIVVVNKNPFRYQYRIAVTETAVAEPALRRFLNAAFLAKALPDDPDAAPSREGARAGHRPASCAAPEVVAWYERLAGQMEDAAQLFQEIDDTQAVLNARSAETKALGTIYDDAMVQVRSEGVVCADLREALTALHRQLEAAGALKTALVQQEATLAAFGARHVALAQNVRRLESDAEPLKARHPACFPNADRDLRVLRGTAAGAESRIAALSVKRTQTLKAVEALVAARREVETLGPEAFYTATHTGEFKTATVVAIKLERKDLRQDNGEYVMVPTRSLEFGGGPRFSLAVGPAWSSVPVRSFKIASGFARTSDGAFSPARDEASLANVVALGEDSTHRILGMGLLHCRLWKEAHVTWGLTAHTAQTSTAVDLLVGGSWALADRKLFVSAGGYWARQQRLDGGLFVGANVPDSMKEPPVRSDRRWGVGIVLSYAVLAK